MYCRQSSDHQSSYHQINGHLSNAHDNDRQQSNVFQVHAKLGPDEFYKIEKKKLHYFPTINNIISKNNGL